MHIFISHSSKEAHIASELCRAIEESGSECFIAPRDIRSGYEYAEEIVRGVDDSYGMLLILSEAANTSPHVLREIERAVTKSIPILVYKVEEVELTKSMEYFLMTHQWVVAGRDSYDDVIRCINNLRGDVSDSTPSLETVKDETKKQNKTMKPGIMAAIAFGVIVIVVVATVFVTKSLDKPSSSETGGENTAKQVANGTSEETPLQTTQEAVALVNVQLGDAIVMGSYHDEEMYWRVLKLSEDKKEAVVVSRDVITVKAYDAPDSGQYNHDGTENYAFSGTAVDTDMELQAYVRGNSSWENSNIRTWLNSASENVEYEGQAPSSSAMADGANGYNSEKGFLCNFTEEELSAIKETEVVTKGNVLSGQDRITTKDKVFLLSMDELKWFEEANVSLLAVPTQGAIDNNGTYWYQDYCIDMGVENMMWWLREPVDGSSSKCYLVGNGYKEENIYEWEVGVESFGIRPAMTVDLTSAGIRIEGK